MSPQVLAIILSVVTLIVVLVLLRFYFLPEKYAVLWLVAAVVAIVLSIFPSILDAISGFFGISQPINLVFAAGFFIVLMLLMQLSLELARTRDELRKVVQNLAVEIDENAKPDE
ncbi:hypothetical protein BH10ACT7_BH10ACT7_11240 [soil metagenome]